MKGLERCVKLFGGGFHNRFFALLFLAFWGWGLEGFYGVPHGLRKSSDLSADEKYEGQPLLVPVMTGVGVDRSSLYFASWGLLLIRLVNLKGQRSFMGKTGM